MDYTTEQGKFVSNGQTKLIPLRAGFDWIEVYNISNASRPTGGVGSIEANDAIRFYWQKGMPENATFKEAYNANGSRVTEAQVITSGGILFRENYNQNLGPSQAFTAISVNQTPEITSVDHGLQTGDVVRLYGLGNQYQLGGFDMEITRTGDDTFTLPTFPNAPLTATGTGTFRKVIFNNPFVPKRTQIINIAKGDTTTITTSVPHGYSKGDIVRFTIDSDRYGTTQLNGMSGTVIEANAPGSRVFVVDINSTSFTAFEFPDSPLERTSGAQAYVYAQDIEYSRAENVSDVSNVTENEGQIIAILPTSSTPRQSVAGADTQEIYWRAGKSFKVSNPTP